MSDISNGGSQPSTHLLQKLFVIVTGGSYIIDTILRIRSQTLEPKILIELSLILLIPLGYFIIAYLVSSRKRLRLTSVSQSMIASIAAYSFWNALFDFMPSISRAHSSLKMSLLTALAAGLLLLIVLLYLRHNKNW